MMHSKTGNPKDCDDASRSLRGMLGAAKWLVAVIVLLACGASDSWAFQSEALPATNDDIAGWIQQLGSSEFEVRDGATRRLSGLTTDHLGVLEDALAKATDLEVRVRLSSVIAKLKYERQQRTIKAFLRDPNMSNNHELDGWTSFSRVAGSNRSAKRLFLQLYDRYPELVEQPLATSKEAAQLAKRVARGIQEDELKRGEGSGADGLALLYCLCAMEPSEEATLSTLSLRVFLRAPYNQFFRDPQAKKPMEAMMEKWASSLEGGADQTSAILIMLEAELNTVLSVARRMLQQFDGPNRAEADELLIALQVMFRFGKKEDLPLLERWLTCTDVSEESVSFSFPGGGVPGALPRGLPGERMPNPEQEPGRTVYTVEVRDAAVLACMQISGMAYREYFPNIVLQERRGYLGRSIASAKGADDVRVARIDAWKKNHSAGGNAPKSPQ
ncbi:MAG: hypothetical protein ACK52S_03005 [Pirellula sp.]